MILRRLAQHLKEQNWTAIAIEFVLLVLGVFLGIQVANWNQAHSDERAYRQAMLRLADEGAQTIRAARERRVVIEAMLADVRPAIEILRHCETGAEAESIVNRGLNVVRSGRAIAAPTLAIDQLVGEERLLARQSENVRQLLRRYHADLRQINATAEYVLDSYPRADVMLAPLIGFTELVDAAETFNKVDVRRAVLNAPLPEACKSHALLTQFYAWERAHVFQLSLLDRLEATAAEGMRALRLTDRQPDHDQARP